MVRRVYIVLVAIYAILAGSIFLYQTYNNTSSEFNITIIYQNHSWIETFTDHDHIYDTITINAQVTTSNYESIFQPFRVGIYPFRVDVSQWKTGDTVNIGGSTYEVASSGGSWRVQHDVGTTGYAYMYYDKTTGVFLSSYSKVRGTGADFLDDYMREITIESSNLDSLIAAITGSNIVWNIGLLTGIVVEIPLILWLKQKREMRKAKLEEEKSPPT